MRIDPEDRIAGHPILAIRNLPRRRGALRYLQAISRYLSFHREKELEIIEDGNHRMGWSDPVPPHNVLYEAED